MPKRFKINYLKVHEMIFIEQIYSQSKNLNLWYAIAGLKIRDFFNDQIVTSQVKGQIDCLTFFKGN